LIITRNDIGGTIAADKITEEGIMAGYIKNFQISRNNIIGIVSDTSTTASGIFLTGDLSTGSVFYNKIRDIKNTDPDGYGANGIWLAAFNVAANVTVHNNFISDVTGVGYAGDSEEDNGYGIVVTDGGGYKIWFNTVWMNTSQTSAGYPAALNVTSGVTAGGAIDLRNNILVNTQTQSGDRYAINSEAPAAVFSPINNNAYYSSGTNIAYIGGADRTNLAGIQAGFGGNANSVVTLPVFVSTTDLHLVAASNAGVDNKGTPVAITTDIDEETRSVTPDLGADEMPAGADTNAPGITYTALGFACSTSDRTLTATIIDASGVPTTGSLVPRIYYKKSTGGTWYSKPGTLSSGTANNGVWSFTITVADMGGVAVGDVIQYYVIAQDVVSTPNIGSSPAGAVASNVNTVTTHPSSPSSYSVNATLSGTFTVGTGGNYTTLTAAVNAYNNGCLAGPVTFNLISTVYQAGESFPLIISNPLGNTSLNTLVIKPATGVNASINADSTAFILDGSQGVVINGSNTGGTTRNLTISNSKVTGATILIRNGAQGNAILNNIIKGVTTVTGVIELGGSTAATGNNNNLIQNNEITKGATSPVIGIYNTGTNGKPNTWNYIQNNKISDFSFYGVLNGNGTTGFSYDMFIDKNEIYQTGVQTTPLTGIMINNLSGIDHMWITNNNIHDLNTTATTGSVVGIDLYDAVHASVTNNMISIANNTTSVRGIAQEMGAGARVAVINNTVSLSGNAGGANSSYAFLKNYTSTGDSVFNNIFLNMRVSSGTGNQYSIANTNAGTMLSNYNDLYSAGSPLNFVGRKGTTDYATLSGWKTGTGYDANSVNHLPVFVAANNLHLSTSANLPLDNKGTPIINLTIDIDNDTRSTSTPDIGADEFTASTVCVAPSITVAPTAISACVGGNAGFTVTASGTNLIYQWRKNTTAITWATIPALSLNNVSAADAANYDVTVSNGCGSVTTTAVALTVNSIPVITTPPAAVTVCALNAATFTVAATTGSGTLSYQWKKGGVSIAGATSATYTISSTAVGDAGQYSVTVSNGACSITSTPVQLTVNACTAVASLSADVTSAVLMPSVVSSSTRVKIVMKKATRIEWTVSDAAGNVVMRFNRQAIAGSNEFPLAVNNLAAGTYQVTATSSNGRIATLRFVKQ
jgi:hypothetical protein